MKREQKAWICSYFKYFALKKNQPADSKSNKVKQDQDNGDQLDKEALSLVLNIFLIACNALGKAN